MPKLLPIAAAIAAALFVRREWQKVNRELDRRRGGDALPVETLRRDEQTGEWRPSR